MKLSYQYYNNMHKLETDEHQKAEASIIVGTYFESRPFICGSTANIFHF